MNIQVKLFAVLRDIVGSSECTVPLDEPATAADVVEYLAMMYPGFAQWREYVRVAVNREYVLSDHVIFPGDEVAIIPPVSGG